MLTRWLLGAAWVSAGPDTGGAPAPLQFPPARVALRSETLQRNPGPAMEAAPAQGIVSVRTPAGAVTYRATPGASAFDPEGRGITLASLRPGVRGYYLIEVGPRVVDIGLD